MASRLYKTTSVRGQAGWASCLFVCWIVGPSSPNELSDRPYLGSAFALRSPKPTPALLLVARGPSQHSVRCTARHALLAQHGAAQHSSPSSSSSGCKGIDLLRIPFFIHIQQLLLFFSSFLPSPVAALINTSSLRGSPPIRALPAQQLSSNTNTRLRANHGPPRNLYLTFPARPRE